MSHIMDQRFAGMVKSVLQNANVIVMVADARYPQRCVSRAFLESVSSKDKRVILCLNKADLIPKHIGAGWRRCLHDTYQLPVVCISARDRLGTRHLRDAVARQFGLLGLDGRKGDECGLGLVGLPNAGKSTVANLLKGSRSASTSPKPGHTVGVQSLRVKGLGYMLYDTPGVVETLMREELPLADQLLLCAFNPMTELATEEMPDAATRLAARFEELDPAAFEAWRLDFFPWLRAGQENKASYEGPSSISLLFAQKLGKLQKGGVLDERAGASLFLQHHLSGKIPVYEHPPSTFS